jgi:hypothetical protein
VTLSKVEKGAYVTMGNVKSYLLLGEIFTVYRLRFILDIFYSMLSCSCVSEDAILHARDIYFHGDRFPYGHKPNLLIEAEFPAIEGAFLSD